MARRYNRFTTGGNAVKYLAWLLKAAIFFVLFAFALNNQEAVEVQLFLGASWQAPLVIVLLAALVLGVFLGMGMMLPSWLRARRAVQATPMEAVAPAAAATTSEQPPHGI
jgi:lipopolysaccharide assembly protein A